MSRRAPELYGISIITIAQKCKVSLRTARRWKDGQIVPPETALMVLRGDLGCFAPEWAGWTINGDELIPPFDGWTINRNHALAVPLMEGQIQALRAKVADLQETHDALEEQPEPGDIPVIIAG